MVDEKKEFGILIYDVPTNNKNLYYQLRSKIRKVAIRMNLSVYLIPWGMRDTMQSIIDDAQTHTGQYASVTMMKFDNSDETELNRVAQESMLKEIRDVATRLSQRIEKAREKMKELPDTYITNVEKQLNECDGLVLLFGLSADVQDALDSAKKLVRLNIDNYHAEYQAALAKSMSEMGEGVLETVEAADPVYTI